MSRDENEGMKHDEGKQKWPAMPLVVLEPLADVFAAGVEKYKKFNCLKPFTNADERFWNSTMRHLVACQIDPLAIDQETGCYHAAQACFGMLMRIYNARPQAEMEIESSEPMTFKWGKVEDAKGENR